MTTIRATSTFPVSPEALYAFHADVRNLARISPPLPKFTLLSEAAGTQEGDEQRFRLSLGPVGTEWTARITALREGSLIEDTQVHGPFRRWRHRHAISADPAGSRLTDTVSFRLLPTPAGEFVEWLLVAPGIRLMFVWRHARTKRLLRERVL